MRILILGGGAGGLFSALALKKENPSLEIHIFDKEDKLGKKLYATGNGHCNISNLGIDSKFYNNPEFVQKLFGFCGFQKVYTFLNDFCIPTKNLGNLVYPLSFSAGSLMASLEILLKNYGVVPHTSEKAIDYGSAEGKLVLHTDKGSYEGERLIVATGGASSPNLGSDGSFYGVLRNHGYKVNRLRPGLTSVRCKGGIPKADGSRHECLLKAFDNGKLIYQEEGEAVFRHDGLSGICVFNAESVIERNFEKGHHYEIVLDLFPQENADELSTKISRAISVFGKDYMLCFLGEKLSSYVGGRLHDRADARECAWLLKNLAFEYTGSSGFMHSQVTLGGLDVSEVSDELESRLEKGVYFVGEVLDIDGLCGGFNLSFAIACALRVAKTCT